MITVGDEVTVTTSPLEVYRCRAADIKTLVFRAGAAALTLTFPGGAVGKGLPLDSKECLTLSKTDFPDATPDEMLRVYAVADVATTLNIYGFLRE